MSQLTLTSQIYTVEVVKTTLIDRELWEWFREVAEKTKLVYESKSETSKFPMMDYIMDNRVVVCRRGGKPVGIMMARLEASVIEPDKSVLFQDLLFAEPGTRAAKILLDDFIDFGRRNANYIVTCIGSATNIKERSLQKLGFEKLETLYRIEV